MKLLIIFGGMIVATAIAALVGICIETYNWNKGRCRKCGGELLIFDYDFRGGRGYRCEHNKCSQRVWISYKCVDGKRK